MIPISRPTLDKQEIEAVRRVLESGLLAQGSIVEEFERAFSAYIGSHYAIATSSGTSALQIALQALDVRGGEVITTPFSYIATSNAIIYAGAKPVFVDIGEDFNIAVENIRNSINSRTRAIVPVHLFGNPCYMEEIMDIAQKYHLLVVEDACQAHGAEIKGKKVGSFSTSCFSFYPTKNMICGEGGMIVTDDPNLAQQARLLRNHGSIEKYKHILLSYNFRMTDIEAAIGLEQLKKLESFIEKRIAYARFYRQELGKLDVLLPEERKSTRHVFNQYTLRLKNRDHVSRQLLEKGIGTSIFYPRPIYAQEAYRENGFSGHCPISEAVCREVLSLPIYPSLQPEDLKYIVSTLKEVL